MTLSPASLEETAQPAVSRIGRFYVTRELGRGAVGCVYLAHDPVIDRPVALKTFNPRLTPADRNRHQQQFINEARAAGRLSHPNIVTVYDAQNEGGVTYIAMEYLQGRELNRLLDHGHSFKPHEVAAIAWKLADALDHAHRHGVIHRDIKPANIFMVKDDHPKLVDFGIARSPNRVQDEQDHGDQPFTLFRDNNLLGTPYYMSPEQASGKQTDLRSDIYSLGAVMYEMLVGRKPFESKDQDKLLALIAHKAPVAPCETDSMIPAALSEIVMKAMSKRPEKRYETAEQMALDIKRYLLREKRARRMPIPGASLIQPPRTPALRGKSIGLWLGWSAIALAAVAAAVLWIRRFG